MSTKKNHKSTGTKSKKNSTRMCTLETTQTKDLICRQSNDLYWRTGKSQKKFNKSHNNLLQQKKIAVSKKKARQNTMPGSNLSFINKKKMQSIKKSAVQLYMQKQAEIIESSQNSRALSSYSKENICSLEDKQEKNIRQNHISMSLATNQIINQIFEVRKQRTNNLLCAKTFQKRKSQQKQIQCFLPQKEPVKFGYTTIFAEVVKKVAILPYLSLDKDKNRKNQSAQKIFQLQTKQFISQNRKKWRRIHEKLHNYITTTTSIKKQQQKIQNIIINQQKSLIMKELVKQGQLNFRWFEFQENLGHSQLLQLYSMQLKQNQKFSIPEIPNKKEEQKISSLQYFEGKYQTLCFDQSERYNEEGIQDQTLGKLFLSGYNLQNHTWKDDLDISSDQSQMVSQNNLDACNKSSCSFQHSDQNGEMKIDFEKYDQQDQILEQKTDIIMNWLIDQFVIQLASQLDLQLFYGLQSKSEVIKEDCNIQQSSRILNKRIEQMYLDCLEIDSFSISDTERVRPVIFDGIGQICRTYWNKKIQVFDQLSQNSQRLVKKQLKTILISRKDLRNALQSSKKHDQLLYSEIQNAITHQISQLVFKQIIYEQFYHLLALEEAKIQESDNLQKIMKFP